ncbi:hypothetical protein EV363DRAFT_164075 [Boletus edulis]|uniref:Uncharacterized protein n=1 Tax=Boletus edulis BED1 TaxID=1328754 RepID=A0AAD4GC69_BOLED|nr:hypothetical protein EV363DRAFT_164075 [Boletus edulis]KAF8435788.1 hypothetical protein L210DRAFT_3613572 [Boletus edulis BED1]
MRRAQSVRTYPRTSLTLTNPTDPTDLSVLHESEQSTSIEDTLRKQLVEKERENDKLQSTILALQTQLASRPPLETIQSLEKEYKNLDLILQGTQRENERCMAELERVKMRERLLEQALAKVAGENWQTVLDIGPSSAMVFARTRGSSILNRATATPPPPSEASDSPASQASIEATLSQMEQIRLLVLGMEQRMQEREGKLTKTIERAEAQELRCKEMLPTRVAA